MPRESIGRESWFEEVDHLEERPRKRRRTRDVVSGARNRPEAPQAATREPISNVQEEQYAHASLDDPTANIQSSTRFPPIISSRPTTPPQSDQILAPIVSPHALRWLDRQLVENPVDPMRLETRAWEIADTVGEVEEHMLREIAESEHSLEEEESSLSHGLEDQATRYNSYEAFATAISNVPTLTATLQAPSATSSSPKRVAFAASSESSDSVDSLEPLGQAEPPLPVDTVPGVTERGTKRELSNFVLGMGMWCEAKGITREDYTSLREVLNLSQPGFEDVLPTRLSTLLEWCRGRLPIPTLHKVQVPVLTKKQPSRTSGNTASLYYLDPRVLCALILSTHDVRSRVYFGMAQIVESPKELWQSKAWGSSIRTCGADYAKYSNGSPIFPSDFIEYGNPMLPSLGRVVFVGRDCRQTPTKGSILLRIQRVARCFPPSIPEEYTVVEDWIEEIAVFSVIQRVIIDVQRYHDSQLDSVIAPSPVPSRAFLQSVFSLKRNELRSALKLSAIRGELEIEAYGRDQLTKILESDVVSMPLMFFTDDFGLYRNMYRSLSGIYLTIAGQTLEERQKTLNGLPVTLGPHGSDINDVASALHHEFTQLERGCSLMISGKEKTVWAPILAFTGDMKSQQALAGFMGPRADYSCRMCFANSANRDNMSFDIVTNGRYHHETIYTRTEGNSAKTTNIGGVPKRITKAQREAFFSSQGMLAKASAFQRMTPGLDLIHSRPGDPAHSEFSGIVRRIMPVLCNEILLPKSLEKFSELFRKFPLAPGWGRIQSPATHMGSWTMSECARASVVVPLLLYIWPLKTSHIRKPYQKVLEQRCADELTRDNIDVAELVIRNLAKIAKSNSVIATTDLTVANRAVLEHIVLSARKGFAQLMNVAHHLKQDAARKRADSKKKREASKKSAVAKEVSAAPISDHESIASHSSFGTTESQAVIPDTHSHVNPNEAILPASLMEEDEKMAALPNVHTALHFATNTEEYGLLWNVNTLPGERMHKVFKSAVLATNHRKVERQLLLKSTIQLTVRLAVRGAFAHSDSQLTNALNAMRQKCPHLFRDFVPPDLYNIAEGVEEAQDYVSDVTHLSPLCHGKIKRRVVESHQLPTNMSQLDRNEVFYQELHKAMASYSHTTWSMGAQPLSWFEQMSFLDPDTRLRISLRKGQVVRLKQNLAALIEGIFTHCFERDGERRIFFMGSAILDMGEREPLLDLSIVRQSKGLQVWALLDVLPQKPWMLSLREDPEDGMGKKLLYCDWDVKFS